MVQSGPTASGCAAAVGHLVVRCRLAVPAEGLRRTRGSVRGQDGAHARVAFRDPAGGLVGGGLSPSQCTPRPFDPRAVVPAIRPAGLPSGGVHAHAPDTSTGVLIPHALSCGSRAAPNPGSARRVCTPARRKDGGPLMPWHLRATEAPHMPPTAQPTGDVYYASGGRQQSAQAGPRVSRAACRRAPPASAGAPPPRGRCAARSCSYAAWRGARGVVGVGV
jgi:hypothetical protein